MSKSDEPMPGTSEPEKRFSNCSLTQLVNPVMMESSVSEIFMLTLKSMPKKAMLKCASISSVPTEYGS